MQEMLRQKGINWHDYLQGLSAAGISRAVIARKFTVEELAQLPPFMTLEDPDLMVTRQVIAPLEFASIAERGNRVDVIFRGCTPEPITEPRQATSLAEGGEAGPERTTACLNPISPSPGPDPGPGHRAGRAALGAQCDDGWWGPALVQVLFGDIPTPADAPPLVWALWGAGSSSRSPGERVIGSLMATAAASASATVHQEQAKPGPSGPCSGSSGRWNGTSREAAMSDRRRQWHQPLYAIDLYRSWT